jgi:hypothetical protein
MSHRTEKRQALSAPQQMQLATVLERTGDVALSQQLHLARQTLARAVAGFPLNSESRHVLQSYLDTRESIAA